MEKIDNLDRKILGILSKNARIPFKDVAAAVLQSMDFIFLAMFIVPPI